MSSDDKKNHGVNSLVANRSSVAPEGYRMVKVSTGPKKKTDSRMRTVRNLARSAKGTCDEIIKAISSGAIIPEQTIEALAIIAGQCGANYEQPK